jgi:predicted dehydrogenase
MRAIGFAVIGNGPGVRTAILPAFARAPEHARLVAVVARDRADRAGAAPSGAVAYTHDELPQCLQRDDVARPAPGDAE